LVTFSFATIGQKDGSRNLVHQRAFGALRDLLGGASAGVGPGIPLRYLNSLEFLAAPGIHFVIRLNLGSRPPNFYNGDRREAQLTLVQGERVVYRDLWY